MPSAFTELLSQLVASDSVNPSRVAGGAGEAEIAAFVAGRGRSAGLAVEMVGHPARPSVVLRARGSGGGRTLLLCAHAEPPIGASYWADSGFIAAAGIPTVLFGPGGEGAHAAEERVSLRDTDVVARTLVEAVRRFCR